MISVPETVTDRDYVRLVTPMSCFLNIPLHSQTLLQTSYPPRQMSTTMSVKSIRADLSAELEVEIPEAPLSDAASAILTARFFEGDFRASPVHQSLLDEYKAQTLKVESVKEDLKSLHENPELYFQNRKRFLFHCYTQSLDQCKTPMTFDIMVLI
jgi:hypothetical protein